MFSEIDSAEDLVSDVNVSRSARGMRSRSKIKGAETTQMLSLTLYSMSSLCAQPYGRRQTK